MILLALFLLSALFLGYVLSLKLKFLESVLEKAAVSLILGLSIATLVSFVISFLMKSLSQTSIALSVIANLAIALWTMKTFRIKLKAPELKLGKIGIAEIAVLAVFLVLAYFNSLSISEDENGNILAISNTWADYALHVGIINSFAMRGNFPPIYPNLAEAPMRYPFLVDFLSAILVKEGVPITYALTFPNFLLLFCLISLSYAFLKRFLGKKEIAAIAVMLFFFNGNLGFVYFLEDYRNAGDKGEFLQHLKVYSNLPEKNIHFMNLSYSVFIPQRAALMGFPLVMLLFLLLWRIYRNEAQKYEYLLAGLALALLPMIHTSSFLVAGFSSACIFLIATLKAGKIDARWFPFIAIVILIALPQIMFINEQERRGDFFGPQVGWMSRSSDYAGFAKFWLENAGAILVLGLAGIFLIRRDRLIFSLPFFAIFIAANLVRFQPWEWDNVKIFMYWLFLFTALAAAGIFKIYEKLRKSSRGISIVILAPLIFISIFSGLLTFYAWNKSAAVLWSAEDRRVAEFIASNTEPDAIFLAAGKHNHLVYTLAGRQILAGYDGHLWSHGLDYYRQSAETRDIFQTADIALIRKWEITYIYIGPQEIAEWQANLQAFETSPYFEEIYYNKIVNARIFRVNGDRARAA